MRTRALIAVATALPLVVLGSAQAAGRGCTPLVVDADRDTRVGLDLGVAATATGYSVPGMDVVSADLRSDDKRLAAVIRLAGDANDDLTSTAGQLFHVEFTVGLSRYEMTTYRSAGRVKSELLRNTTSGGNPEGQLIPTYSADGRTLTLTAPAASFAAVGGVLPSRGTAITGTFVSTQLSAGGAFISTNTVDTADTLKTYRAGAPTC